MKPLLLTVALAALAAATGARAADDQAATPAARSTAMAQPGEDAKMAETSTEKTDAKPAQAKGASGAAPAWAADKPASPVQRGSDELRACGGMLSMRGKDHASSAAGSTSH